MVESKSITVIPSEWIEFGEICDREGMDRSKLIRIWIKRFIDKHKCLK